MKPWLRSAVLSALLGMGATSCAGPNLWTDLGSVSTGRTNRGRIRSPARMAKRGRGWTMGERWRARGLHYGTDELVAAVARAAGRVRSLDRRATLGVADFSRRRGGPSPWHGSHHAGRDVDLIFYTVDEKGRPMKPPGQGMIHFDDKGKPFLPPKRKTPYDDPDWEKRRFDTKRNWQLVEALLSDASIRVQWIFVSNGLRNKLLGYAKRKKRPKWVRDYAAVVLRQPGGAAPHDDHFHVRVYCSRSDKFHGCRDSGPVWHHEKKKFKYFGPERYDPVAWRLFLTPPRPLL